MDERAMSRMADACMEQDDTDLDDCAAWHAQQLVKQQENDNAVSEGS